MLVFVDESGDAGFKLQKGSSNFNKTNRKIRKDFLNTVRSFKFRVRAIMVKKELIRSQRLRSNKEAFYNYIEI
ncbi:MAG: hypothetical protein U0946_05105 [Patescibacteria group bacterium]|nr:hypothetical protein [Patescibacteria group bacterium]